MVVLKELYRLSKKAEEYINITEEVHQLIRESGVKNGIAAVITSHTTTGIFVNEALPCVESDISDMLEKSAPLNETYAHAHFLPDYGATGNNSQGHLKSLLTGNHCVFPVIDGEIVRAARASTFSISFCNPSALTESVQVI